MRDNKTDALADGTISSPERETCLANLDHLTTDILPFLHGLKEPRHLARVCRHSAEAIEAAINLEDLIGRGVVQQGSENLTNREECSTRTRRDNNEGLENE